MSRLSDAYDRASRRRSLALSALLLVGSLVAAVGFAVTATSLIVGFGVGRAVALRGALVLGGAVPLSVLLVPGATRSGRLHSLALAGVGVVAGLAGLALCWTTLPTGWSGDLTRLPQVALGTYATGLVAAFAARLAADFDDPRTAADSDPPTTRNDTGLGRDGSASERDEGRTDRSATVSTRGSSSDAGSAATLAVGDGGENDDDVAFFDDE